MDEKITVIIPTMNRVENLAQTLSNLLLSSVIPSEIIVVDQSTNDDTKNMVSDLNTKLGAKGIIRYFHQDHPSLTAARNFGCSVASNDLLIFSDDDVDVEKDTIKNVALLMSDKSVSMIAGKNNLEKKSKSLLGYLFGFKSFKNRKIGHVTNSMLGRFPNKIKEKTKTMWAMGFFFAVRKKYILSWGLRWDEKLTGYAYAEDLDFSFSYYKKSIEQKLDCILSSLVCVNHNCSAISRLTPRKVTFMYVLNRAYLLGKHNMVKKGKRCFDRVNRFLYLKRLFKKDNPKDIKDAIEYLDHNFDSVLNGEFNYGE